MNITRIIKWLKYWWTYRKLQKMSRLVDDDEFADYKEGKPISADLAMKIMQGDKKAINELRGLSPSASYSLSTSESWSPSPSFASPSAEDTY
jgi:hypothetical protein